MPTEARIKIYGDISEKDALVVLAAAHEKGLQEGVDFDYYLERREDRGECFPYANQQQCVRAVIPEHGNWELFDSKDITMEIARSYPNKGEELLCGPSETERMLFWMRKAQEFDNAVSQACLRPGEGTRRRLCKVLGVYEERLRQSHRLACGRYTLADLHHLPSLQQLMDNAKCKNIMCGSYPYVRDWARGILARTAWVKKVKPMLQQ